MGLKLFVAYQSQSSIWKIKKNLPRKYRRKNSCASNLLCFQEKSNNSFPTPEVETNRVPIHPRPTHSLEPTAPNPHPPKRETKRGGRRWTGVQVQGQGEGTKEEMRLWGICGVETIRRAKRMMGSRRGRTPTNSQVGEYSHYSLELTLLSNWFSDSWRYCLLIFQWVK